MPNKYKKISLAHSPDADDAFMFYAIVAKKINLRGYEFENILCDIQTLSKLAIESQIYDITAISYHVFPKVSSFYELMPCGSSMGENYGPIVITSSQANSQDKNFLEKIKNGQVKIAVPGFLTSAYLALKIWSPQVNCVEENFNEIQDLVENNKYQAGLIIHEGQIYLKNNKKINILEDLGKWWSSKTNGLILPLGANIIRKNFPEQVKKDLNIILKESISYALENKKEALEYAMQYARDLNKQDAEEFVGMYVNNLTLELSSKALEGIKEFYRYGKETGLIDKSFEFKYK